MRDGKLDRRKWLTLSGLIATGSALAGTEIALTGRFHKQHLQVWSCGGLADAFLPAKEAFEKEHGCSIDYTGAFAGALGKSLLGSATTEVFAPRSLELARKLRVQEKMLYFFPLCFSKYVLITPKGNPGHIGDIHDMARPGVRTVLSPGASPPGGESSMAILQKAGVLEGARENAVVSGDCVQRILPSIASGEGDVAIVENRLTVKHGYEDKFDVLPIAEQYIPPKPIPFTIGLMKWAKNRALAEEFIRFTRSAIGQDFFLKAGFIPADSAEGKQLVEKYGVRDA